MFNHIHHFQQPDGLILGIFNWKQPLQSANLINDTAQRPNISFETIVLRINHFRCHVGGSPSRCLAILSSVVQQFGYAEVPHLQIHVGVNKYILGFYVPVDDLVAVHETHSK